MKKAKIWLTAVCCLAVAAMGAMQANALVKDGVYVDLPAKDCGVASLTVSDQAAVIGKDAVASKIPNGEDSFDVEFDCSKPLSITLTDGTELEGDDAYTYLGEYEQFFSFNFTNDEFIQRLPKAGTAVQYTCTVCSDLAVCFTVYFVADEDAARNVTLETHTVTPGQPLNSSRTDGIKKQPSPSPGTGDVPLYPFAIVAGVCAAAVAAAAIKLKKQA